MVSEIKGNAVKEFHIPMYFLPIAKYSGPKIAHHAKQCPSLYSTDLGVSKPLF